jgi:hypothetical protein
MDASEQLFALFTELIRRQDEILLRLDQLAQTITGRHQQPKSTSASDQELLARILPLIYDEVGSAAWSINDLRAHAELPNRGEWRQRWLDALASAGGALRLGRLLARAAAIEVNGLTVERRRASRDGCMWRIITAESRHHHKPG